jgi:hypothetical protein
MDAETIHAITALTRDSVATKLTQEITALNGDIFTYKNKATEYGRELGELIVPPRPQPLAVTTLTGFVDALKAGEYDAAKHLVHVEDYLTVTLKDRATDQWGWRTTRISAKHTPTGAFMFDHYYSDLPKFIIALQVAFIPTEEILYLIKLSSNLKSGNSVMSEDNGFSQTVTVRSGEVGSAEVKVQPRIKLIPKRTFPEVAPVESEFLIRFQQNAATAPSVGLFDVSGRLWEGQQMGSIKTWLADKVDAAFPIIA